LTRLNVLQLDVPRVVTIVIQATRIKASITAYSTAVGPSSSVRKRRSLFIKLSPYKGGNRECLAEF